MHAVLSVCPVAGGTVQPALRIAKMADPILQIVYFDIIMVEIT